jgi:hypothetical protein
MKRQYLLPAFFSARIARRFGSVLGLLTVLEQLFFSERITSVKINGFILAVGTLLLASPVLRADTVSVNLGLSAQNYTLTGLGPNGSAQGTFLDEQGACTSAGATTTCHLTGLYTGSTPGFTGGTYDFVTTYATATPLQATEFNTNQFGFGPTDIPPGTTMFLDLHDAISGNHDEAIYDGSFVGSYNVTFATATCTGVSPCSQDSVGLTPGATVSGPITGGASFTVPAASPVPEPSLLIFSGVPGMLLMVRRRFTKS